MSRNLKWRVPSAAHVKFPGSKLLHHWDLALQSVSLDDLLRSCQQAGLTGFAEIKFPQGVAMIFYYVGGEVNALYREGAVAFNGQQALDRLRQEGMAREGVVSVYELPLDMAHILRGITNRQKLKEPIGSRADLLELLLRMEKGEHTGTLEIQTVPGAAMILLVRGRVSNTYWETSGGLTYEKGDARQRLEQAVEKPGDVHVFLSEFSRDIWKTRHEVQDSVRSRLEKRDESEGTEQVAAEEIALRHQVLDGLCAELPSVVQAFLFDLLTGAILARRGGRSTSSMKVGFLADKIPSFTQYVRDLISNQEQDDVEVVEVSTTRMALVVAVIPETQEALAVLAERAQPTALIAAALARAVRSYAARALPLRSGGSQPAAS
jgi:hypothetical protein